MMKDGSINWNKYKINLNSKIERPFKKQESTGSNLKTIGKIKRKKCKIFQGLIFKIQEHSKTNRKLCIKAS